jgi:hypothetical protein
MDLILKKGCDKKSLSPRRSVGIRYMSGGLPSFVGDETSKKGDPLLDRIDVPLDLKLPRRFFQQRRCLHFLENGSILAET